MRHGTGRSIKISMKTDGSARFWMKFGTIFTLAAWKNCRDWQDAPAFLEGLSRNCRRRFKISHERSMQCGDAIHFIRPLDLKNGATTSTSCESEIGGQRTARPTQSRVRLVGRVTPCAPFL